MRRQKQKTPVKMKRHSPGRASEKELYYRKTFSKIGVEYVVHKEPILCERKYEFKKWIVFQNRSIVPYLLYYPVFSEN
jgi:hypothetical protein